MFTLGASAAAAETMEAPTYRSVPNRYVVVEGRRLAYRSLGPDTDAPPLLLLQHFTGTMDDWDSRLIDGLARRRKVIVLGNPGIGASAGPAPESVAGMARVAEDFLDALHLETVDVLGFSIGGAVAQVLVAERPDRVRKLVLVGTGPSGGEGFKDVMTVVGDGVQRAAQRSVDPKVALFFIVTEIGRAAGDDYARHIANHQVDPEPPAAQESVGAQANALITWGLSPPNFADLQKIRQPVLIVNGSHDLLVPTINSYVLYQHIPNAYLNLYPDSGHGALFQHHALFVSQVDAFLDGVGSAAPVQERPVRHVTQRTGVPFDAFVAKFEAQLGRNDLSAYLPLLEDPAQADRARAVMASQAGSSGLMIFDALSIGRLMALDGRPVEAIQYLIGNPLVAHDMVREDIRAGLSAPLRVLVHADAKGRAIVEYDAPSSTFGWLGSARIDAVARGLDGKLAKLIDQAAQ